jgi:hypothetical protein
MTAFLSPELAMVDPILRSDAIADLPRVEEFDFLRFGPRRPVALDDFGFLAEHEDIEDAGWRPPLAIAASLYAVSAITRVAVMDGLFVLGLAAAVALVNVFG